ncbi:ankyrin repeat and KH domain-containing protein mask-like [Saccostrea cucullata]|uniref:ankyrin repeat and KH domain-containing protein mask-like n=1 Tax=Saccostrea cuccullata TaxID=36930 RepID=UPI002ED560F0
MNKERNMECTKAPTMPQKAHSHLRGGFGEQIGTKNEKSIKNMKVIIRPSEHETLLDDIINITFVPDLSLQDEKRFKMKALFMALIETVDTHRKRLNIINKISTGLMRQYYSHFIISNISALERRGDAVNKPVIIVRHDMSYQLLRTLFKASSMIHKLLHLMSEYTKYKSYGLKQKLKTEIETPLNGLYPIHIASLFHNVPAVELLLEHGADVNVRNDKGWTALLLAVAFDIKKHYKIRYGFGRSCRKKTIYTLLKHNADVNLCTTYTSSPLCLAITNNFDTVAQLLLTHGADIHRTDNKGRHPIHIACISGHLNTVELLLEHQCNVDARDHKNESALIKACRGGFTDIVRTLIQNNANINLCNHNEISPLSIACMNGHYDIVKLLISTNADVNLCDKYNRNPISYTCSNGNKRKAYNHTITRLLLTHGADIQRRDNKGRCPIHIACISGHLNIVELLLEHQCNINARDHKKESPLVKACRRGFSDIVRTLIQNNAIINLCNHNEISPLSIACMYGHYEIVKLLISSNADVNLCDKYNKSPLLFACLHGNQRTTYDHYIDENKSAETVGVTRTSDDFKNIVDLLLRNHAIINCRDNNGISPLQAACLNEHEETVKLLLGNATTKRRILVDNSDRMGRSQIHLVSEKSYDNILLQNLANVNIQDANDNTPLLQASKRNNYGISCLLLENSADLNLCDRNGNTPLHHACYNGNEKMVTLFLHRGADINSLNKNGETPLIIACKNNQEWMFNLLFEKGADINMQSKNGDTALLIASRNMNDIIVKRLLNRLSCKQDINSNTNFRDNFTVIYRK